MFSVYGTSGRLFRGSMEQLRHIGGVGALSRANRVQVVGQDGRDLSDEATAALLVPAAPGDANRQALAAYASTQTPPARHVLKQVKDLMTPKVVTLASSATVIEGWQLLSNQGVGQAPVVQADGTLVGLLTRADLLRPERLPTPDSHALVWRALMLQNVTDIMVTPVPSVSEDSDIRRVARVLLDTGLPGLPVVDDAGQVSGFISRSDILRAVVTDPPLDLWG